MGRLSLAAKITVLIGVVLDPDHPARIRAARGAEQARGAAAHGLFTRALETLQTQESLTVEHDAPLFVVYRPIANQERCQGCHGADHRVRAVVRVATSMAPVFAEVDEQRNRQIAIAVLTIAAAAAVLTLAMRRIVVRPIRGLAAVARRIGDGDFEARAAVASGDEIGQLGSEVVNKSEVHGPDPQFCWAFRMRFRRRRDIFTNSQPSTT